MAPRLTREFALNVTGSMITTRSAYPSMVTVRFRYLILCLEGIRACTMNRILSLIIPISTGFPAEYLRFACILPRLSIPR